MLRPDSAPDLDLWAQCHSVGPDGYADSDGEQIDEPTIEAAEALLNHHDQLQDICWVDFSLFVNDEAERPYRVGESIIAVRQRRIHSVRFQPVSEVLASGEIPPHTAKWMANLAFGNRDRAYGQPDRFEELLLLAHETGALAGH